jgi:hypothetical protein
MFSGTRQFEPAIEIDGRVCWHLLLCDRLGFGTSPGSRETLGLYRDCPETKYRWGASFGGSYDRAV